MTLFRLAAATAHFGRDLDASLQRVLALIAKARESEADLLVLPHAALGGYLADLRHPDPAALPPALTRDDPIFAKIAAFAGSMVVCVGFTELDAAHGTMHNAALCLTGDGVLGRHRKVHQPPGESSVFEPGNEFNAFDTPVGRVGMLIDYDKTFPESSRALAIDGARVIACLSAWPASVTQRASSIVHDRQTRLFELYDIARAAENQVVVVSANQSGSTGGLRFLGHSKVVGPGGAVLARTGATAGLCITDVDVDAEIDRARLVLDHLRERRLDAYDALAKPVSDART